MQGSGERLTRKQEQALAALLAEPTIAAAAERASVNEATLYRWLKQEDFKAAFRSARREVVEKAIAQLQNGSWAASTTLLKLLGAASDSVRLRAAVAILDQANKGIETLDFEARLSDLEDQAGGNRGVR